MLCWVHSDCHGWFVSLATHILWHYAGTTWNRQSNLANCAKVWTNSNIYSSVTNSEPIKGNITKQALMKIIMALWTPLWMVNTDCVFTVWYMAYSATAKKCPTSMSGCGLSLQEGIMWSDNAVLLPMLNYTNTILNGTMVVTMYQLLTQTAVQLGLILPYHQA